MSYPLATTEWWDEGAVNTAETDRASSYTNTDTRIHVLPMALHGIDDLVGQVWRIDAVLEQFRNGSRRRLFDVQAFARRTYTWSAPAGSHVITAWNSVFYPLPQMSDELLLNYPAVPFTWATHYEFGAAVTFPSVATLPTENVGWSGSAIPGSIKDYQLSVDARITGLAFGKYCYGFLGTQWHQAVPMQEFDNADVNKDGFVNGLDTAEIVNSLNWGKLVSEAQNPRADVNQDGFINGLDVAAVTAEMQDTRCEPEVEQ